MHSDKVTDFERAEYYKYKSKSESKYAVNNSTPVLCSKPFFKSYLSFLGGGGVFKSPVKCWSKVG